LDLCVAFFLLFQSFFHGRDSFNSTCDSLLDWLLDSFRSLLEECLSFLLLKIRPKDEVINREELLVALLVDEVVNLNSVIRLKSKCKALSQENKGLSQLKQRRCARSIIHCFLFWISVFHLDFA
jgi:hypothetical protein